MDLFGRHAFRLDDHFRARGIYEIACDGASLAPVAAPVDLYSGRFGILDELQKLFVEMQESFLLYRSRPFPKALQIVARGHRNPPMFGEIVGEMPQSAVK